jgi:protein-S-isoprenylcysteine O-methyltransferase Ste14
VLDNARYVIAILTVGSLPFALGYWYMIHPAIAVWRRVGPAGTYAAATLLLALNGAAVWYWRDLVTAHAYPVGPVYWVSAAICYGAAIAIELQCRRHLKFRTLAGLPELEPSGHGGRLLQEGIYARVRHPRYISVAFGVVAAALFCNYASVWITTALTIPALYGIVLLEERELRDRFGAAYVEYSRRVPRFVPRLR